MITPLYSNVLVRPIPVDETVGKEKLIVLAESHRPKPQKGTVLATGDGIRLPDGGIARLAVRKGDVVYYGKYAGSTINVDDEELIIMREEEIVGTES